MGMEYDLSLKDRRAIRIYEMDQRMPDSAVKASGTNLACQYEGTAASYSALAAAHSFCAKNIMEAGRM